ncbi:MAG: M24 family metallopeptidase [Eubacteriales bacterium]|nr:Xaa-Pro peptidase family protein [Bacillota bacterium]
MKKHTKARIEKLILHMAQLRLDAVLMSRPAYVYYFTDVLPGKYNYSGVLIDGSGKATLLTASGEAPQDFEGQVKTYQEYAVDEICNPIKNAAAALEGMFRDKGWNVLGIDMDYLPARLHKVVNQTCGVVSDVADLLDEMTITKDAAEIALIKKSISLCDNVHRAVADFLKPGVSELELYSVIQRELNVSAGEPIDFICDCVTGERTVDIGGKPTPRQVKEGDLVIIDILPYFHGYYGDTTRTFVVGRASEEQKKVYQVLQEAMTAGEAKIKAGTPAKKVYASVKHVIEDSGYGDFFPHHAGHGIGLGYFERPLIIPASDDVLKAGSVITLEPGIYLPGLGGMRLENNYLVTEDGFFQLSMYPNELKECL